jgi:hypothetical protein
MHCNENTIYVFPEKELCDLSPNFHIHVSVSDLNIPRIGPHIFLQQNVEIGTERPRYSFSGNICFEFSYSVFALCVGCFVEVAVYECTPLLDETVLISLKLLLPCRYPEISTSDIFR